MRNAILSSYGLDVEIRPKWTCKMDTPELFIYPWWGYWYPGTKESTDVTALDVNKLNGSMASGRSQSNEASDLEAGEGHQARH